MAQYSFLEYAAKEHEVTLIVVNYTQEPAEDVAALQAKVPGIKIHFVTPPLQVVQKGIGPSFLKLISKIQWRLNRRYAVAGRKSVTLNPFFIYPIKSREKEVVEQIYKIVEEAAPDLVQFDFINNADLVDAIPASMPKILIDHDLRFSSIEQVCKMEKVGQHYSRYLTNYVKTLEVAFINRFDTVIAFSEEDKERLSNAGVTNTVVSMPFAVLDQNLVEASNYSYRVDKLVFVGPEHHDANYDAIHWYCNEMASNIWKEFKLKLFVIGNWSSSTIEKLGSTEGVEFRGYVADLKKEFENSLMLVPIRIGSGIRTKLLDAFGLGVPVITTSVGCEGLGVNDKKEVYIADNKEEFYRAIKALLSNKDEVAELRKNGSAFVKKNNSQGELYKERIALYKQIAEVRKNKKVAAL